MVREGLAKDMDQAKHMTKVAYQEDPNDEGDETCYCFVVVEGYQFGPQVFPKKYTLSIPTESL